MFNSDVVLIKQMLQIIGCKKGIPISEIPFSNLYINNTAI